MASVGEAALATAAASPAGAVTITELVVFGDSNVDIGRAADPIPNDGQFPAPNTVVGGRSSDGPILPEFVASRVGVGQLNVSFGDATSGETNIVGVLGNEDLLTTGTLSQITEYETKLGFGGADPDALHLVWAGSNDLFFADENDQSAVEAAVAGATANLEEAVLRLTDLGAGTVVLATRTPRPVLSEASTPSAEPVKAARNDAASRQLNDAIHTLVRDLGEAVASDVLLFDDYEIIRDAIEASDTDGLTRLLAGREPVLHQQRRLQHADPLGLSR